MAESNEKFREEVEKRDELSRLLFSIVGVFTLLYPLFFCKSWSNCTDWIVLFSRVAVAVILCIVAIATTRLYLLSRSISHLSPVAAFSMTGTCAVFLSIVLLWLMPYRPVGEDSIQMTQGTLVECYRIKGRFRIKLATPDGLKKFQLAQENKSLLSEDEYGSEVEICHAGIQVVGLKKGDDVLLTISSYNLTQSRYCKNLAIGLSLGLAVYLLAVLGRLRWGSR
jgi:hypothetical protein